MVDRWVPSIALRMCQELHWIWGEGSPEIHIETPLGLGF